MSLKDKLLLSLKSKKGNALLLATATAIAASFSVYFFVAISALSQEQKERIAHLYNAYQMGLSISGHLDGTSQDLDRIIPESDTNKDKAVSSADIDKAVGDAFKNTTRVKLSDMVGANLIRIANDPTQSNIQDADVAYDVENSTVLITHLGDSSAELSAGATDKVRGLKLLVNLAGTKNAAENKGDKDPSGYDFGTGAFFYIIMDTGPSAVSSMTETISSTAHPVGILSAVSGGPQPETSVLLPSKR